MSIRNATVADIECLLNAMQDFYVLEKLPWDRARQRQLLQALLGQPESGYLLLAEQQGELAAYAVVGLCYGLEFHGRFALLDELYVLPQFQGIGLASRMLEACETAARTQGCNALRLEVSDDNPRARAIYEKRGYRVQPRRLMSYWLQDAP
ncbi:GNAT family N-acetyltransferase [Lysobacteraceae bacterium NML07-0707]|nr:GNAT family N-acetyltransferase [Xanthomonadaceae bacterium NML07-0707]